jgi:hypothetical protein
LRHLLAAPEELIQPSLAGNRQVRHEVADDMPGAILEARIVGIAAGSPEYSLIEGR